MKLAGNFLPSTTGLKYTNNNWPNVPDKTISTPVGNIPLGSASNGLCGGMVFAARDLFEAHRPAPPAKVNPAANSPAFTYVVNRLFDSMNIPDGVAKWLQWMTRSRHDIQPLITMRGLSWWTIVDEMAKVRATIDQGHPCPLGLATPEGHSDNPLDMGKNHVVMAYGYEDNGSKTAVRIYDPNYPMCDDITITFDTSAPDHTTDFMHSRIAAAQYGFFALDFYSAHDPSPLGLDGNTVNALTDGMLVHGSDGAVYMICGNAKFHVPDPATLARVFPGAWIYPVADSILKAIGVVPKDGTLLREESGAIAVIIGGAAFHVPDPATMARLFPNTAWEQLWNGALASFPAVPVNGTLLREESGSAIYLVLLNGTRAIAPAGSPGPVHVLWNGALSQVPLAPGTIQGVVRDSTGNVLRGATVLVGTVRIATDNAGAFSAALPPGTYQVSATEPAYLPSAAATVTLQPVITTIQNMVLAKVKAYTFTGKVTDVKGTPVNGATLTSWEADAGVPGRYLATTNAAGVYSMTIDPGPYQGRFSLIPSAAGFVTNTGVMLSPLSGQTLTQNFILNRPGVITGKVTESDNGKAVAGAHVSAGSVTAATDATGSYSLTIPTVGPCSISPAAAGFEPAPAATVNVAGDAIVTQNFVLVKALPATITGVVTSNNTGKGMRATVTYKGTGASASATCDAAGAYTLSVLSGPAEVTATASQYIGDTESIKVLAGQKVTLNFNLDLTEKPPKPGPGPKPQLATV